MPVRVILLLLAALCPALLGAQSISAPLTRATHAAIIDSVARQLARHYISADTAQLIASELRRHLAAGAYASLTNPAAFAEAITRDLRAVNGDLHLSLRAEPVGSRPGAVLVRPGADSGRARPATDSRRAEAARRNYGLGRLEVLPGNVGYLEVESFFGAAGMDSAIASAMRYLERTDAIIIDLRRNGGGSGEMSHLIFSHFLGSTPVPTIRVVNRGTNEEFTMHSVAEVPGPRRQDVPLYILTSGATASAAEEFSFVMRNQRRATLVGSRTAGAGHMVQSFDAGHGFSVAISITRVTDPASGLEWERVGVQPHVPAEPAHALDVAHAAALRRLAEEASDARRRRSLMLHAETAEAQAAAAVPDESRLRRHEGRYEGGRSITVERGALHYARRAGDFAIPLVPLGDGRFAAGDRRFTFDSSGSLTIETADGTQLRYARRPLRDPTV